MAAQGQRHSVHLGIDEDGEEVRLPLYGASLLVAGSPGSGKSTALRAVLAGLAGQRDTALVGSTPMRVELTPWRDRLSAWSPATRPSRPSACSGTSLLKVQHRAARLADQGLVAAPAGPADPRAGARRGRVGRAGGRGDRASSAPRPTTCCADSSPSGGQLAAPPSSPPSGRPATPWTPGTRALHGSRLALRCGDRWQSEAILGQGNDQAARIPLSSPGWGLHASGPEVRGVQVYDLDPSRIPQQQCRALAVLPPW